MGFLPHQYLDGAPDPFDYLPAAENIAVDVGTALKLSSGKLVLATGASAPEFICMKKVASCAAGEQLPVLHVSNQTIYETTLAVASESIAIGNKYTIDTTGGMITATTASGVAEVLGFDGTAEGDKVRVKF